MRTPEHRPAPPVMKAAAHGGQGTGLAQPPGVGKTKSPQVAPVIVGARGGTRAGVARLTHRLWRGDTVARYPIPG